MDYKQLYSTIREQSLWGRYITPDNIEGLFSKPGRLGKSAAIGQSVNGIPIHCYQIGQGKIKVLMWSQMHGNESTSTKALFDLFNYFDQRSDSALRMLEQISFCIIPMLNPDGALLYTRENAAGVDLNRDFVDFSQPETVSLQKIFEQFKPNYCFNLHDQRTIFGVGNTGRPATISFLSPAFDASLTMNRTRLEAVSVIMAMVKTLEKYIPGQIGRFDDSFNAQCAGDHFQATVPTVLIEAGHYNSDYDREQVRMYFLIALLSGIGYVCENDVVRTDIADYHTIPQNSVSFYDIVYKNVKIIYDTNEIITNFATQYQEELIDGQLQLVAYIVKIGPLDRNFAHITVDAKGKQFKREGALFPELGQKADFYLGNDCKVVNGLVKTD